MTFVIKPAVNAEANPSDIAKSLDALHANCVLGTALSITEVGSSRVLRVGTGNAFVAGHHVQISANEDKTLSASATHDVYIHLVRNGNNEVTGAAIRSSIDDSITAADAMLIAQVVTNGSEITTITSLQLLKDSDSVIVHRKVSAPAGGENADFAKTTLQDHDSNNKSLKTVMFVNGASNNVQHWGRNADSIVYRAGNIIELAAATTKPTNVPLYTICLEYDTGILYYYNGSSWVSFVTQYASHYEVFGSIAATQKQRFYDHFGGANFSAKWQKTDLSSTNTFQGADGVDEGSEIVTSTTNGALASINCNNRRQFSHNSGKVIMIFKRASASCQVYAGLSAATTFNNSSGAAALDGSTETFKTLYTADGAAASSTASDVAVDTNFTLYVIELGASNIKLYINGVLKITKTTNRPSAVMQPIFRVGNASGVSVTGRIRYYEAYNI